MEKTICLLAALFLTACAGNYRPQTEEREFKAEIPPECVRMENMSNVASNTLEIKKAVMPYYPKDFTSKKLTGCVLLSLDVTADGQVEEIRFVESFPNDSFDPWAEKALKKWQFKKTAAPSKDVNLIVRFLINKKNKAMVTTRGGRMLAQGDIEFDGPTKTKSFSRIR